LDCRECHEGLQDYLDGTLDKQVSLRFFLHMRECSGCQEEHDRLQGLYEMLQSLPDHAVPEGFDEAILASVPYEAYRAMEPLRRERVPVYLEEEFLPAWVRSPVTRVAGLGAALASVIAIAALDASSVLSAVIAVGVVPQVLVSLQGLGRRVSLKQSRAEG
jgi:anti-sigma factor RsiW